jgi:hypothetical protein
MAGAGGVWNWLVYSAHIIGRWLAALGIVTPRTNRDFASGPVGLLILLLVRGHSLPRASGAFGSMNACRWRPVAPGGGSRIGREEMVTRGMRAMEATGGWNSDL